ncbi:Protein kinase-like domain [Pseudocohnilembus persalinus]|uniref:non-specific serine/threonine protein kinase n=1 Tax=Pseudocohnilembus persalinus TaxID=266149 RepID=A0A0V0QZX9_PSEPJ|nr:Protein kinase-like domain [Pseudocohnilembus persalinus]|eukprot:KRX07600.1 Protein kinase-like domain [Pseudocohnilembus persalinus]
MGVNQSQFSEENVHLKGLNNEKFNETPQYFQIDNYKIKEISKISEGGFGYIWRAVELESQQEIAVKRMICSTEEQYNVAKQELNILKHLPHHQNVVEFYTGKLIETVNSQGQKVHIGVFIMELCDNSLQSQIEKKIKFYEENSNNKNMTFEDLFFNENFIISVISQISMGIDQMHTVMNPSITHRDIKVDNVLIKDNVYKIVDFGSSSEQIVDLKNLDKKQKSKQQEIFDSLTTLMYRPPEMCDTMLNYKVNQKVDIWMMGCILYTMMFLEHPFKEQEILKIISGGYNFMDADFRKQLKYSKWLYLLLVQMLTPNPQERINIQSILKYTWDWQNHVDQDNQEWVDTISDWQLEKLNSIGLFKDIKKNNKNTNIIKNEQNHNQKMEFQQQRQEEIKNWQNEFEDNNCNLQSQQKNECNKELQKQKSNNQEEDWGDFEEAQVQN